MRHKCPRCGKYRKATPGAKIVVFLHPNNYSLAFCPRWVELAVTNLGYCRSCESSLIKAIDNWWRK